MILCRYNIVNSCPKCGHTFEVDTITHDDLPKSPLDEYPISDFYKPIDALDIIKSDKIWIALIFVESQHGKKIRIYRWEKRNEGWKVDLCRMSIENWNWLRINQFVNKYQTK